MPNGIFTLTQQARAIGQGAWVNGKTPFVDYLVVAGGGGGGGNGGAGGGGGGLLQGVVNVAAGSAITVTVGAGGSGGGNPGASGANSVFGGVVSNGGGGGGYGAIPATAGAAGGSGGGSAAYDNLFRAGAQGIAGQGNSGGPGLSLGANNFSSGGGGGAGTVGFGASSATVGGNGGAGIASDISGTRTAYAGGGGGGGNSFPSNYGNGGAGGGGGASSQSGIANTGGGAGGTGNGGSGVVIISYPDTYLAPTATTGSPTVSTSGSGSISNSGANNQGWRYAGQSAFAFGTGDFTIEFFIYLNSLTSYPTIYDARQTSGSGNGPVIYYETALNQIIFFSNGANRITGSALSTGQWYHIAVSRSGTSTRLFVDGTQVGSTYSDSTNYVVGTSSPTLMVNCDQNSGGVNGYISNLRVVKGTAVYTANFTRPSAPLTAITNTSLLLSTVSGSYFVDSSTNAFTPTITGTGGNPVWNQLSPFATGLGFKNRVYTWTSSGSITF